jgi:hypothetical protein
MTAARHKALQLHCESVPCNAGMPCTGRLVHGCRQSGALDHGQQRRRTEAEGGDEELPTDLLAKLRRPAAPPCSCVAAADSSPNALLLCSLSPGDVDTLQHKCKLGSLTAQVLSSNCPSGLGTRGV